MLLLSIDKEKPHYNKTHDLICSTRSIARVFAELSEQKKVTIEEMEFGALRHIPKLKVLHKLLKELILCFDLYHGFLDTRYGKIYITPAKIGDALGLISGRDNFSEKVAYNKLNEQQKEIADCFKGATLAFLTKSVTDMSVEGDENLLKFKMTFILFVQKCFLLSTTTSTVSLVQKPPLLHVETFPDPEADDAPRPPWLSFGIPTASPQRNFGKPWHKSTDLEKLVEAVIDAGLTIALQYAEQTSVEPSLSTPEGYKTPVKEKEVIEELREKCY
ncbi:hypothetical protein AHAS_Ahas01G0252600 [Arachis hypogaea]